MERKPLTRQRSKWEPVGATTMDGIEFPNYRRNVHDGVLLAMAGVGPWGWHMSISFRNHHNEPTRYPTWDEIAEARDRHLPAPLGFTMAFPPEGFYVALHDTTFHLHEHPQRATGVAGDGSGVAETNFTRD